MKHTALTFILCLGLVLQSNAQVYNLLGTPGDDYSQSGTQLSSGDYIIFGNSKNTAGQQDGWLVRCNAQGEKTYAFKFGGSGLETGTSCAATPDGGYQVTGSTNSNGAGGKDIFVIRFRADNSIAWQYSFGGTGDEESNEIITTSDSGAMVVGYTRSYGNASFNSYILKLSKTGSLQWNKVFYSATSDVAMRCLESQGYYYISNNINASSSFGLGDLHLTKLDKNGNFIWNKAYGGSRNEGGWKLIPTMDKQLAMVMQSNSYTGGTYKELVFIKMDTAGKVQFCTRFTNNGKATDGFDLLQLKDSSYVIVGHTLDAAPASWRGILVHMSKTGTLTKAMYTSFADEGNLWQIKKAQTSAEFAIFGYGKHSSRGNYDFIFGIADSTFNLSCLDWKAMTQADLLSATIGEKEAKTAFSITSGATVTSLSWSTAADSVQRTELNYNSAYSTAIPAIIYRCTLDSVKLDAGLQQRYLWSNGATTRSIYAKSYGMYYVKFLRNYCIAYDSVLIAKTLPDPIALPADTCTLKPILIGIPAQSGKTYSWSNGEKTSQITAKSTAKYTLTVTDTVRKCTESQSIIITFPGVYYTIAIDSIDHCFNTNYIRLKQGITLRIASDKIKSLAWWHNGVNLQNGGNTFSFTAADTGVQRFRLDFQTTRGCADSAFLNIKIHPNPIAKYSPGEHKLCYRENEPLFYNQSSGGGRKYVTKWNWGDGSETLGEDTVYHNFYKYGKYPVLLTCISENGCTSEFLDSIELLPAAIVKSYLQSNSTQCIKDNNFQFQDVSYCEDASQKLSNIWICSDGTSTADQKVLQKKFSSPGKYTVQLIVSTAAGCSDSMGHKVEVYNSPGIDSLYVNDYAQCLNENKFVLKVMPDTFKGPRIFHTGDGRQFYNSNEFAFSYNQPGIYQAMFIAENVHGCTDGIATKLTVFPSPDAGIDVSDSQQCLENNLFVLQSVTNNPGDNISWNFSDGFAANGTPVSHSFISEGKYFTTLVLTDNNACSDTASNSLLVHPKPVADFNVPATCEGEFSEFTDNSKISTGIITRYLWYFDNTPADTIPIAKYQFAAGTHGASLVVQSVYGCKDSVYKNNVVVHANPIASFDWSIESESMEEDIWLAKNTSANTVAYEWRNNFGETGFTDIFRHRVSDSHAMWMQLKVWDVNGCTDTVAAWKIFPFSSVVLVPNAFTPDANGRNEIFIPFINKNLQHYDLYIFNRWGEMLFHTSDPKQGWDGSYMSAPCPDGIYVYHLSIGSKYEFGGTIHLLR